MFFRNLILLVLMLAMPAHVAAQTSGTLKPVAGWTIGESHFDGKRLMPAHGRWVGVLRGNARVVGTQVQAIVMDGRSHSFQVSDNIAAMDLPRQTLTLEAWVVVRRPQPWGGIISALRDNGDDERGYLLGFRNDRFCFALASEATGKLTYLEADRPFDTAKWHHVVGTYDGTTMRLYVDGRLAATSTQQSGDVLMLPTGWFELGAYRDDDEFFPMQGLLHEALVYDGVMSETQVKRRYAAKLDRLPAVETLDEVSRLRVHGPFAQFVSADQVRISWETSEPTPSVLEFGPAMDQMRRYVDAQPKVSHSFVLNIGGVNEKAVLHYRIIQPRNGGEVKTRIYDFECEFNDAVVPPLPERPSPYPEDDRSAMYRAIARQMIDAANFRRGYCLVLGAEEGRLAYELARLSDMQIVAVESDPARAQTARRKLDEAGLYGTRVSVLHVPLGMEAKLPFAPYFANLVVSESMLLRGELPCSSEEVYRVLRPYGGVAYLGQAAWATSGASGTPRLTAGALAQWLHDADVSQGESRWLEEGGVFWLHRRGALPGGGDWSHQYASADNSAAGGDDLVDDDLRVLWWGRPGPRPMPDRGARNPAPLFTHGNLFVQGNRILFGLDGYNGTVRWSVQVPEFRRANLIRDCSNMAAAPDHLYIAGGSRAFALEAQTGICSRSFEVPPVRGAGQLEYDWGYIGVVGDLLLGSSTVRGGAYLGDEGEWYNDDTPGEIGKVVSESLFAYDRKTGKLLWTHDAGVVVNATITVRRDTVYFLETRDPALKPRITGRFEGNLPQAMHLVALDLATGQEKWARSVDVSMFRYMAYLVAGEGAIVAAGSDARRVYHLQAYNDTTGEPLWQYSTDTRKKHHSGWLDHPVVVGQRLFANRHTFELCTGEVLHINEWDFHGCGIMSASNQTMFQRMSFHGMWDLDTGKRKELAGVRTGCWLGLIPAGGMLLAPESSAGCSCTHAIQTTVSFIPRKSDRR